MKRSITRQLDLWQKAHNRKPLIIRGARQVGKTYSITEFGSARFKKFVKIDFEKQISLRKIFSEDLEASYLVRLIEVATNTQITPGESLLFLDEIQHCPRALMALRYFYEELPELHIIAAGSLLEFEMEKISFPVGRVEFLWMFPLTFEEFLDNTGQNALLKERPFLDTNIPLSEFLHHQFLSALKKYILVGGMPEVVKCFVEDQSLLAVKKVHEQLVFSLLQDIPKYENKVDIESLHTLLTAIPRFIGHPIKYSELGRGLTHYRIKKSIEILEKSLLVHRVLSSSAAGLPLGGNINKTTCKVCFIDLGLMQYLSGISADQILHADKLDTIYEGAICEQFIGQELIAHGGSQQGKLYYWSRTARGSQAEIDYLLVHNGNILPLEVKKGEKGRLKSMHIFLEEHPSIKKGFVLSSANIAQTEKFYFRPLYTRLKTEKEPAC